MVKSTFPPSHPGCIPCYVYYDNACNTLKHLWSTSHSRDPYFDDIGFVVDVFHARNKHHEDDAFCVAHSNPVLYQDLLNDDGTSWFNSSAAEQVNKWYVKFLPIVRGMLAPR